MPRPAVISFEDRFRLVLAVFSGEMTVAEAARRSKVSEQSIGNWKRQFLEGGKQGLADGQPAWLEPAGAAARGGGRGHESGARGGARRAAGLEEVR
jgi:transposase-like protein